MIFFGSRGKAVPGQLIEGVQCPNCGNQQFVTFGVIRYFHLYWIPTFPTTKNVGMECTHCKKTLLNKEIPNELSSQIKASVFNKKNTLPMFSGAIIIAALILFGVYVATQEDSQRSAYISQPALNDIYVVDFTKFFDDVDAKYKYGALRITELSSTQAEFQVSNIAYNKASGVNKDIRDGKASVDSYYSDEPIYIETSKLKSLQESGAIYSIKRL